MTCDELNKTKNKMRKYTWDDKHNITNDYDFSVSGQKFAYLEMKSVLSKILRNFQLLPAVPEHKIVLVAELTLKSQNGIKIKLAERKW